VCCVPTDKINASIRIRRILKVKIRHFLSKIRQILTSFVTSLIITVHNLTINHVFNCFIHTPPYANNLISSIIDKKKQSIKVASVVAADPTADDDDDNDNDDDYNNNSNSMHNSLWPRCIITANNDIYQIIYSSMLLTSDSH